MNKCGHHQKRDCGYGECKNIWGSWECHCKDQNINPNGNLTLACIDPCDLIDCGVGLCQWNRTDSSHLCRCFAGFSNDNLSEPCRRNKN